MEDFLATVLPRPADTWGYSREVTPNLFCVLPNFIVLPKNCFKHMIKTKIFPHKMYFLPQTLKRGYGPSSAKIVSAIRIFCFEDHSASKCSRTSKIVFVNRH